jgi:hypothetical protein
MISSNFQKKEITYQERDNVKNNNYDLDEILDLDKHKLSIIPEKRSSKIEKWFKYLGLPVGILVFSLLYYTPIPAGLTASGQAIIASFSFALVLWISKLILFAISPEMDYKIILLELYY